MFFLKAAFCRVFQTGFKLALPVLPYREPTVISSCAELKKVFEAEKLRSVLVVTDKGIVNNGLISPLETVLNESGVNFALYDNTQPNPTVQNVEEALALYNKNRCARIHS